MLLYHLDRTNNLRPDHSINLIDHSQLPKDLKSVEYLPELCNGLSQFGLDYLKLVCATYPYERDWHGNLLYPQSSVTQQLKVADPKILELVFELVRKAHFPHLPSRFQSFFAVKHLNDFSQWPELCATEDLASANILSLDVPDDTPRFDSNWLRGGLMHNHNDKNYWIAFAPALCFDLAYKYWSQIPTGSPRWEYLVSLPISGESIHSASLPHTD